MSNSSSDSSDNEAILWYYAINVQQYGPVSESEMIALYKAGTIHSRTRIWCKKLANWTPLNETELYPRIFNASGESAESGFSSGPPPLDATFGSSGGKKKRTSTYAKEMEDWYNLYWIMLLVGVFTLFIFVGVIPLIIASFYGCFILYRAWKTMPRCPFDVPPLIAVLFAFAPIAGTIWGFWLYYFFTKEINKELEKRKFSLVLNENFALVACILAVPLDFLLTGYNGIPWEGVVVLWFLLGVPSVIFSIFAMREIKNGAIAIHEDNARQALNENENEPKQNENQDDNFLGGVNFNSVK